MEQHKPPLICVLLIQLHCFLYEFAKRQCLLLPLNGPDESHACKYLQVLSFSILLDWVQDACWVLDCPT